MFGFYSFSEKPFSAAAVATAAATHEGGANLQASGILTADSSLYIVGSEIFESSGNIIANNSLVVSAKSSLSSTATISAIQATVAEGASLLVDSGTVSSNGTLLISGKSNISASGDITADGQKFLTTGSTISSSGVVTSSPSLIVSSALSVSSSGNVTAQESVIVSGSSSLPSSGTIEATSSVIIPGEFNVSGSGTIASAATVVKSVKSSIEASGSLSSDIHTVVGIAGSLSGVATVSAKGTAFKTSSASITGSGVITNTPTNLLVGKADLTSPGVTLTTGTFGPGQLKASLSASATVTSQIGIDYYNSITIGTTFAEFIKGTKRLSYVPAMPLLSHKDRDIVLDFPFYEGAGNLHGVSSRKQVGNIGNLSWGRVDGRQSLTSTGTSYSNNRISFDTNGISLTRSTIVISFKPISIFTNHFLFNLRGTANNNNEIDCYIKSNQKITIDIYNGTSKQTITTSAVNLNQWNTLVLTWDNNLKAYLNGADAVSLGGFSEPAALGSTFYIAGRVEDNFSFAGSIDHFRVYNRELENVEAKEIHKNINKDYTFNSLIPNHYRMSEVSGTGRILKNGSADIIGNGTIAAHGSFILANLKSSFGGLAEIAANGSSTPLDVSSASLSATATFLANGILLGELDIVPFTVFINRLENYDQNVYQTFVKEMNVARSKIITASIDQQKTNTINIDKILEKALEK